MRLITLHFGFSVGFQSTTSCNCTFLPHYIPPYQPSMFSSFLGLILPSMPGLFSLWEFLSAKHRVLFPAITWPASFSFVSYRWKNTCRASGTRVYSRCRPPSPRFQLSASRRMRMKVIRSAKGRSAKNTEVNGIHSDIDSCLVLVSCFILYMLCEFC